MPAQAFKAVSLTNEVNLNRIAAYFGINRKFKWEESLILGEKALKEVLREPAGKLVYIFPFGSMVFINFSQPEIMDAVRVLAQVERALAGVSSLDYIDDYRIEVAADEEPAVNNDSMLVAQAQQYHRDIVATVLAKSVALERIEADIGVLLDEIEDIVAYLRRGHLNISDEQLAKISARIMGFKLSTLSYIMLLDKPDITWVNEDAAELFNELSALFELSDRHETARHKTGALMDITEVFAGLVHAKRGTRLEWAVIILISIEIVLSLIDKFFR